MRSATLAPNRRVPVPSTLVSSSSLTTRRLRLFRASFVVVLILLSLRLTMLQVVDHAYYARLSLGQVREDLTTTALRAGIYDRYGQILAVSRPTSLVIADDFQIAHPVIEAQAMAHIVKVPVGQLTKLLSEHHGYVVVNGSLDLASGHQLSLMNFPGIVVQSSSVRTYPDGTLATSLIGRVNASGVGSSGLEYQYQKMLAGQSGVTRAFVSASGVNLPNTYTTVIKKAQPGVGLELTIDSSLQFVAERALAHAIASTGAVAGTAIVMDVHTGQILANPSLVNKSSKPGILGPLPAWGTSVGVAGVQQSINDLAFSYAYEPGSVFKAVTFSAALQAGIITPNTVFTVPNSIVVGGRVFHDAENHGLEHLTATQILAQSSNIGTYEITNRLGEAGLLSQVERLGFGQQTTLNYPGETAGLLVNATSWYPSDMAAMPIGQVDAVPPIQVLDAYNTIANDGVFVEPSLVRGYVLANGSMRAAPQPSSRVALTPRVAATLTKMLEQVVLAGTGTNAIIPGYPVAGKTGTANIPYPGKDLLLPGAFDATFVGFAPADHPVLSMIVVVERPLTTVYGGTAAAPVFQQVMSYALHHYGIPSSGIVVKPLTGRASIASDVT